jgi:hypothetical protein
MMLFTDGLCRRDDDPAPVSWMPSGALRRVVPPHSFGFVLILSVKARQAQRRPMTGSLAERPDLPLSARLSALM